MNEMKLKNWSTKIRDDIRKDEKQETRSNILERKTDTRDRKCYNLIKIKYKFTRIKLKY